MTKTIEIIVSPSGESKLETKGFAGASCQDASHFLEEALGRQQNEKLTAEFHHVQTSQRSIHEQG